MSKVKAMLNGAVALLVRDFTVFVSYRSRVITLFTAPITSVTLFYFISKLVGGGEFSRPGEYFAFVVIGLVGMDMLASTVVTTPSTLRMELVAGTWEHIVLSPLGPIRAVCGMMAWPAVLGLTSALFTILTARIIFGMDVLLPDALVAAPVGVLGAMAFAAFGIFSVAGILIVKQSLAGVSAILTAMTIVGGALFPVSLLPSWIRWASEVQPITPALDLTRHFIAGAPIESGVAVAAAKLVGFTVVLFPLSVLALRFAIGFARRRGTIIEY